MQPTFGVSFGLPQTSHGGYPINPFNANPIHNPYGPALNSGGLNLGLVSVNPLLAVQVTKNDYGEKVVKPFVNLHVTPNEHVVNKLGHIFHEKKLYLLNKHEHYHHQYPYHYKPIHHPHYEPHNIHHAPSHYHGPPANPHPGHVYSPYHSNYYDTIGYGKVKSPEQLSGSDDDYYDDNAGSTYNDDTSDYNPGFYNPSFDRSANSVNNNQDQYANRYAYSRSFTLPSPKPGASRGGQTIRFPSNRKRRDIENSKNETIQEVTSLVDYLLSIV